jgi:DNA polymerase-3 subunit beta
MDGYRDLNFEAMNLKIIVPPKMFSYASPILSGYSSVTVQVDDNNVAFLVHDAKISARLIVGNYPKVRELLPKTFPIMVEVNTVDFADSVARMKLFADKNTNQVSMSFSRDGIKMVSSDTLSNKSCNDSCDVLMYEGEPIEVCTKTISLENIMAKIDSETFCIGMTNPKSPIVFYEADNKNKVLFTMPLVKRT